MDFDKNQTDEPSLTYEQALSFLYSQLPMFSRVGAAAYKPGLDTSLRLDEFFGHPHRKFKSIHIAGTNGKGSTSHMLAAMLQAQGYKTGLYTSPHLVDFRERIRINGEMISKEGVTDFTRRWKSCSYQGRPSFFELTMMMAFDWFAREGVEIAVIETGMGGRLDSTNIISPTACVITNISPDHKQFLGETLEAIAAEKAGIIKQGIPVTIGESAGSIRKVFAGKAATAGAPIRYADSEQPLIEATEDPNNGGWHCKGRFIDPSSPEAEVDFYCTLGGDYQKSNINTVLTSVDMLRGCGIELSRESVEQGFSRTSELTRLAGRWMKVNERPLTICDTGHNEAGIASNMKQIGRLMEGRPEGAKLRMIVGFVNDKEVDHILTLFPRENTLYYLVQASVPRAMQLEQLAEKFAEARIKGRAIADVKEAYKAALEVAGEDDVIYIGGSTFVVADFLS